MDDDERWAVVARRGQGDFLLGVVTTGVFCRPGCPARTPRRENVRFFDRPSEAVAAGFRPCLKCRPLGTDPVIATAVRLARAIEVTSERRWTADELGEAAALSGRTAASRFEKALGISPRAFRDAVRLRRYKGSLRRGERATMAGLDAGYGGEAQRHEGTRALGMTARAYAKGGAGERIAYAVTDTALGAMVLAATAKGVCLLQLMDDEAAARAKLREEFPHAELMEAEGDAPAFAEAVARFLEAGGPRPDLPLDLRGTAFQLRVWEALRAIPPGETRTYGALAGEIGSPGASRAVGSANACNRVAVLVPCHLVVAASGLGGYAGGLERKRRLLALEGVSG
jgi:AraC family transcriptional regulator of adaptative response/methylated-DNA-[protein]-cysteine methyltransferase